MSLSFGDDPNTDPNGVITDEVRLYFIIDAVIKTLVSVVLFVVLSVQTYRYRHWLVPSARASFRAVCGPIDRYCCGDEPRAPSRAAREYDSTACFSAMCCCCALCMDESPYDEVDESQRRARCWRCCRLTRASGGGSGGGARVHPVVITRIGVSGAPAVAGVAGGHAPPAIPPASAPAPTPGLVQPPAPLQSARPPPLPNVVMAKAGQFPQGWLLSFWLIIYSIDPSGGVGILSRYESNVLGNIVLGCVVMILVLWMRTETRTMAIGSGIPASEAPNGRFGMALFLVLSTLSIVGTIIYPYVPVGGGALYEFTLLSFAIVMWLHIGGGLYYWCRQRTAISGFVRMDRERFDIQTAIAARIQNESARTTLTLNTPIEPSPSHARGGTVPPPLTPPANELPPPSSLSPPATAGAWQMSPELRRLYMIWCRIGLYLSIFATGLLMVTYAWAERLASLPHGFADTKGPNGQQTRFDLTVAIFQGMNHVVCFFVAYENWLPKPTWTPPVPQPNTARARAQPLPLPAPAPAAAAVPGGAVTVAPNTHPAAEHATAAATAIPSVVVTHGIGTPIGVGSMAAGAAANRYAVGPGMYLVGTSAGRLARSNATAPGGAAADNIYSPPVFSVFGIPPQLQPQPVVTPALVASNGNTPHSLSPRRMYAADRNTYGPIRLPAIRVPATAVSPPVPARSAADKSSVVQLTGFPTHSGVNAGAGMGIRVIPPPELRTLPPPPVPASNGPLNILVVESSKSGDPVTGAMGGAMADGKLVIPPTFVVSRSDNDTRLMAGGKSSDEDRTAASSRLIPPNVTVSDASPVAAAATAATAAVGASAGAIQLPPPAMATAESTAPAPSTLRTTVQAAPSPAALISIPLAPAPAPPVRQSPPLARASLRRPLQLNHPPPADQFSQEIE